eukprot:jgi/Tetstr1/429385/TSEL_019299.t1
MLRRVHSRMGLPLKVAAGNAASTGSGSGASPAAPAPAPALPQPAAPPAPITLTPADCTKLVEAIAALTSKVVKEIQSLKARTRQARRAPPRRVRGPSGVSPERLHDGEELLSTTGASTHRGGDKCRRAYIKFCQGSKDHLDACGRPVSSPMHYANRAYGAQLDLLAAKPIDDKARQCHELHGYQPPANPAQPHPDRHHPEAYHVSMLTWHWELLHVVDPPLFGASPDGKQ